MILPILPIHIEDQTTQEVTKKDDWRDRVRPIPVPEVLLVVLKRDQFDSNQTIRWYGLYKYSFRGHKESQRP